MQLDPPGAPASTEPDNRWPHITPELKALVAEALLTEESLISISRRLGITDQTVLRYQRKLGIDRSRLRCAGLPIELRMRIIQEHFDGASVNALGKKYDRSPQTIWAMIHRDGPPQCSLRQKRRKPLPQEKADATPVHRPITQHATERPVFDTPVNTAESRRAAIRERLARRPV